MIQTRADLARKIVDEQYPNLDDKAKEEKRLDILEDMLLGSDLPIPLARRQVDALKEKAPEMMMWR